MKTIQENKEQIVLEGKLGEVIIVKERRKNGTWRVRQDFNFCTSKTNQLGAHANDPNYLVKRYKPDELSLYLKARESTRFAITGYDFSREPDAQEARNEVYRLKQAFKDLPLKVQKEFDHDFTKFLKFVDDPRTTKDQLVELGLVTATPKPTKQTTPPKEEPATTPKKE